MSCKQRPAGLLLVRGFACKSQLVRHFETPHNGQQQTLTQTNASVIHAVCTQLSQGQTTYLQVEFIHSNLVIVSMRALIADQAEGNDSALWALQLASHILTGVYLLMAGSAHSINLRKSVQRWKSALAGCKTGSILL